MTYTTAALTGVAAAALIDLLVLRVGLLRRLVFWACYPIVLLFQLLSNGILTGRQIVIYAPSAILGWRIAYAPVEDLLFGFAMVLLTLDLWVWWGRRGVQREPRAGEGSALLRRLSSRRERLQDDPPGHRVADPAAGVPGEPGITVAERHDAPAEPGQVTDPSPAHGDQQA